MERPSGTEPGLADVLTLQRRAFESSTEADERALYQDTLAEYCWARVVAGLSAKTLDAFVFNGLFWGLAQVP
ncbi:hypothetical protein [Streptomyces sp. NPDC058623]|uniref:hypothetical protein n=1 Tax=Streptomyces sp. NPDC058623 TaxID=3346563 RepID=UPI00365A28F3